MSRHPNDFYHYMVRWSFFVIGLIILALGISLTIQAKVLGIGPWDVFHYGLFVQLGLTIGTWAIIAGLVIVAVTSIAKKQWPQIGTVLNMVLIGVFIDFFNWVLPEPEQLWVAIVVFVVGTLVMAYGIGIYVAPGMGAGPRDSLMLVLTETTGWKVSTVRNWNEIIIALLGWMLGGPVGVGTVIIALFLGTMVGFSLPQAKQLLNFFLKKGEKHENIYKGPVRPDNHDRTGEEVR
ncbi:YczE/YyaS/YitT family protein [Thalassobacillus sp. B23F22_16]|uniref:YczE/YyaS/YitT family protein n=1 Tax=Thalassobacillus sp. B23F22_16 TaxID=3459513 RepID=UPI00373E507A